MRKLVLYISASLDSYIADVNGGVAWFERDQKELDKSYDDFMEGIDTVIMGRVTYEVGLTDWYKGYKIYVATTRPHANYDNIEFISGDIYSQISELQKGKGKDIWIVGGAELIAGFMDLDMIDEYYISIIPIILGSGIRLFNQPNDRIKLNLLGCNIVNGIVKIRYERVKQEKQLEYHATRKGILI